MCGLVGFSRAEGLSAIADSRRFTIAGLLSIEDRGPHSTGAAWTRGKATQVWYHKSPGPAREIAHELDLDRNLRTLIGHVRWATHGEVNVTNAHPLLAEGPKRTIVLTHNGVLSNDDELAELAGLARVGETDSWTVAAVLATHGEHPAELLELVEGDAALAWLDTSDTASLHLARLIGRPLVLAWTRRGDLVYASTQSALERLGRMTDTRLSHFIHVEEGTYLRIVAGEIVERRSMPAFERPVRRPLWTPTAGSPAPRRAVPRRGALHGITDLVDERPDDWWDEAEKLLGDAFGGTDPWPTGVEIIAERRARNNAAGW